MSDQQPAPEPIRLTLECQLVDGRLLAPVDGLLLWLREAERLCAVEPAKAAIVGELADQLASAWLASTVDQLRRPS